MNRLFRVSLLVVLLGLLGGCSSTATNKAQLVPVKGTVSLDNHPMASGEIRFSLKGEVPRSIEIKNGTFSGEAFAGKNHVEVVLEKDGGPHPMNPKERIKINGVSTKFWGPTSTLSADVGTSGSSDLKFAVTSK